MAVSPCLDLSPEEKCCSKNGAAFGKTKSIDQVLRKLTRNLRETDEKCTAESESTEKNDAPSEASCHQFTSFGSMADKTVFSPLHGYHLQQSVHPIASSLAYIQMLRNFAIDYRAANKDRVVDAAKDPDSKGSPSSDKLSRQASSLSLL